MDRQIVYPGQIPLETDLLNTNKNTMVALGKLIAAVFGTSTFVSGLACVPTGPASLNVQVNPGEIYSLQNIDGTAYSSLAADTTHQIVKQGIVLDAVTLACAAPATAGQSINYLIQATYQDSDTGMVALPYYNASNPAQAYSGPNNSGTQQATARKGVVTISAKAGIAAATGTQTTPAPDAGYVGLWVVTVANGQTQITAPNIVQAAGAPFFGQAALLNVLNAFTVSPTAPTPAMGSNTAQLATMAALLAATQGKAGVRGLVGANNVGSPTTKFEVSAAAVALRNPITGQIVTKSATGALTCDVALAGPIANGRDQVAAYSSTSFLHLYFIYNLTTDTLALIWSSSATAPTLPAGYTHFAYATTIRYSGASVITAMRAFGSRTYYDQPSSSMRVLNGGVAGAYTAVSCVPYVPSIALRALLRGDLSVSGTAATYILFLATGSLTFPFITLQIATAATSFTTSGNIEIPLEGTQQFKYQVTAGSSGAIIDVLGYVVPNGDA